MYRIYKKILFGFPDLLKQSFNENVPKNNIIHRIDTADAPPVKSKCRRLVPGSQKEKLAKEAWLELVRLGIVEKVDPAQANTWSSPLHFVVKPDKSLRAVGDYRGLNARTVPDHYPLPHVRDYAAKLAGAAIFSKVDLCKAFHLIAIDERDRFKTCVTTPGGCITSGGWRWGWPTAPRLSRGWWRASWGT